MIDPVMGTDDAVMPPQGMTPRQRIAMALSMQRGPQPQGTGILGGLNTALSNGLHLYGMKKMHSAAAPMRPQAPDPVMGTGYGSTNAYDYLKPQGY